MALARRTVAIPPVLGVGCLVEFWTARAASSGWSTIAEATAHPWVARLDLSELAAECVLLVLAVAWTWLLLSAALTLLASVDGRCSRLEPLARQVTPRAWRQIILVAAGVTLLTGPAAIASSAGHHTPPAATSRQLGGLPYPDRPAGRPLRMVRPTDQVVTVRPGDCLWAIASQHGPAQASTRDTAKATQRWYAANRSRIGTDPDLIQPGAQLRAPQSGQTTHDASTELSRRHP